MFSVPRSLRRASPWLVVAIILSAAMLRGPIVAVGPVAPLMEADLGITPGVFGLFVGIPVLSFAVCSPIAIAVIRRGGPNFALTVSLLGAVLGCVIRSSGGLAAALIGTAILGVFVTIGNVVMPVIVARDYPPERAHQMTGVFTGSMTFGAMLATVTTAPLESQFGWRGALLCSAALGVAALAVWIGLRGVRGALWPVHPGRNEVPVRRSGSVIGQPATWILGVGFAGQAFAFYAATAWLPSLLNDRGLSLAQAGIGAGIFQVMGIAGALLMPMLAARTSMAAGVTTAAVGWAVLPLGLLLLPDFWIAWMVISGLAQGSGLTIVFMMITALGGDQSAIAGRSGIVQGVGYAVASLGPSMVGELHRLSGEWVSPLLTILTAVVVFGVAGTWVGSQIGRRTRDGAHTGQR